MFFMCVVEGPILRDYYNLLQYDKQSQFVVEGPILRDYYNSVNIIIMSSIVVEGPILRDYYNSGTATPCFSLLWKVRF